MTPGAKVLIVEDEVDLAGIFGDYLRLSGYEIEMMHTGAGVVDAVRRDPPDIMLLDLMLPEVDGITICRGIRKFSEVPIIMVTARVDEVDRLLGLDIGADDYICKPAEPKEVVARVRAVLRRTMKGQGQEPRNPLQLDAEHYSARWNDQELVMSRVEFRLLELLAREPRRAYSRSQIMDVIYDDGRYVSERSIDSHVKNLRKKLAAASGLENPIRPIYGVGYRLELSEQHDE